MIQPVIMCGGSGKRLWPLSRQSFPKQFVPLISNKSLLQLTVERLGLFSQNQSQNQSQSLICVAAEEHRFLVADALQSAQVTGVVILEPVARNTAAAIALAALTAQPGQLLLFCPADHYIPDANAFTQMVKTGEASAAQGAIVTFGVVPSFPSTAYGHIQQGVAQPDGSRQVTRFIEKLDETQAQALILQVDVLWNAGIFLCKANTLLDALAMHAPEILASCQQAMAGAKQDGRFTRTEEQAFTACRAQSIDYAVMEHHPNVVVLPFSGAWSDVGGWNAVADHARLKRQPHRGPRHHPERQQHLYQHATQASCCAWYARPHHHRHARRRVG